MILQPNETRVVEWHRGPYTLSTDRERIDIDRVFRFLAEESYWARDVTKEFVARSVAGSLALGIYCDGAQVGFARVITDYTRLAYVLDVFIDREHRGRGLGTWLTQVIRTHPDLTTVTRWLLTTVDAHAVYARAGFVPVAHPEWLMEVVSPTPDQGAAADTLPTENRK